MPLGEAAGYTWPTCPRSYRPLAVFNKHQAPQKTEYLNRNKEKQNPDPSNLRSLLPKPTIVQAAPNHYRQQNSVRSKNVTALCSLSLALGTRAERPACNARAAMPAVSGSATGSFPGPGALSLRRGHRAEPTSLPPSSEGSLEKMGQTLENWIIVAGVLRKERLAAYLLSKRDYPYFGEKI